VAEYVKNRLGWTGPVSRNYSLREATKGKAMTRTITFEKNGGTVLMKEFEDSVQVHRMIIEYEAAFSRMTQLKAEGFTEVVKWGKWYAYEKTT